MVFHNDYYVTTKEKLINLNNSAFIINNSLGAFIDANELYTEAHHIQFSFWWLRYVPRTIIYEAVKK